jgi:DNA-binding phage protein
MKAQAVDYDIKVEIIDIGHAMGSAKLSKEFIANAVQTAFEFEGVYDLMKLWIDETDPQERDQIIADIQDMIDECSQKEKVEGVYIRFDDLDKIAHDVRAFKDALRLIVDHQGGIVTLAQLTGIPQSSLSRFFSSASMPRRLTLLKIARALHLSQVQIATEWAC